MRNVLVLMLIMLFSCNSGKKKTIVSAPNSEINVEFEIDDQGKPYYIVMYKNKIVIDTSYLGFEFTAAHPFLTKDGWKALAPDATQEPWISEQADIKYLEVGDYIKWNDLSSTGKWVKIEEIKFRDVDPDTPVYNFKVPGTNTYQVNYTVVHNK